MADDSRAKMVRSAAALIAARGLNATSFADVVSASGAPRGSIYHHFPRGKADLAEAAIRATSDLVLARQRALDSADPVRVLEGFFDLWRQVVLASGGGSGCAVAGSTVDTRPGDPLMGVIRAAFEAWIALLSDQLTHAGIDSGRATALATVAVAGMEGALILCRAQGNAAPLDAVAGELLRLLR